LTDALHYGMTSVVMHVETAKVEFVWFWGLRSL